MTQLKPFCNKLSTLAILNPNIVSMLKANGLEELVAGINNV